MREDFEKLQVHLSLDVPESYRAAGFIYVLSNESMPGVYKIGMTKNEPESRAKEISGSTGVPSPFKVLAAYHSMNPRADEKMIHEAFDDCRISSNREFFGLSDDKEIDDALHEIGCLVGPERGADCADIADSNIFISFSNEREINLMEELYEQGIGGYVGDLTSIRNYLIRIGMSHVKDIITHHHASIVINQDKSISLVKSTGTQMWEAHHEQQCSEG
jgi:hypothetical protein